MDIRESLYTLDKRSIKFIDKLGNEGNYMFDDNKFGADKPYRMDSRLIEHPDPTLNLVIDDELYEVILDKDVFITVKENMLKHGDSFILVLRQDSSGYRSVTFDSNFLFPGGNVPQLTLAPDGVDMIGCIVGSDGKFLCDATLNFM